MERKLKSIFALAGTVCGLIVLILGIVVCSKDTGSWQNMGVTFGGDFYTYSYEASARAANNLTEVAAILRTGLGCLLIAFGLFDICYFGSKACTGLLKILENMPRKVKPAVTEAPVAVPEEVSAAPVQPADPKDWGTAAPASAENVPDGADQQ